MKQNWFEIISIWALVAIGTILAVVSFDINHVFGAFAVLLAGSLALVSLVQLFRAQPTGFVKRLIYVGGGSYLILVIASVYLWLRG